MEVQSQHLLVDFWLKESIHDEMIQSVCQVIEDNLTVIKKTEHKFDPIGTTIVFILGESHFSLHTYPEHDYLTIDIYVCNMDVDLESILTKIELALPVRHKEHKFVTRGVWEEFQELSIGDQKQAMSSMVVFAVTFVLAACSILYELLLAQALSSTMGNTALRYNITIGLYIASMGVGALLFKKIFKTKYGEQLVKTEILLALIGGLAPIMVLINDSTINFLSNSFGISFFGFLPQTTLSILNHSLIVAIGFLSGLELPLLIELGKKIKQSLGTKVLAVDYAGTLVGVVSFPLIIFPNLSLFSIGYLVAFLNSTVALYLVHYYKSNNTYLKIGSLFLMICFGCMLLFSKVVNEFVMEKIYFYNL